MTVDQVQRSGQAAVALAGPPLPPPSSKLTQFAADARAAHAVAISLARTPFVPTSFKKRGDSWLPPEDVAATVTAAILAGDEIGLSPMQALAGIDVIEGKPCLNAMSQRALVQAHGHRVWIEERSADRPGARADVFVTVKGQRIGKDGEVETEAEATWSLDRARQANLLSKKNWQNHPEAMCFARASSEVCRQIAADVLMGLAYSAEELDDTDGDAAVEVRVRPRQEEVAEKRADESIARMDAPHQFQAQGNSRSCRQCGRHPDGEEQGDYKHLPESAAKPAEELAVDLGENMTSGGEGGGDSVPSAGQDSVPAERQAEPTSSPEPDLCSQRKDGDPTKACSRPVNHDGRHHYGRTVEVPVEPEPAPIVDPEATEPALREGLPDPEGAPQCDARHPELGQCSLPAGHEGQHMPESAGPEDGAAVESMDEPASEEEPVDAEVVEDDPTANWGGHSHSGGPDACHAECPMWGGHDHEGGAAGCGPSCPVYKRQALGDGFREPAPAPEAAAPQEQVAAVEDTPLPAGGDEDDPWKDFQ